MPLKVPVPLTTAVLLRLAAQVMEPLRILDLRGKVCRAKFSGDLSDPTREQVGARLRRKAGMPIDLA